MRGRMILKKGHLYMSTGNKSTLGAYNSSKGGAWSAMWRAHNSWRTYFIVAVCLVLAATTLMIDQVFEAARTHTVKLKHGRLPLDFSSGLSERNIKDITVDMVPHSSGMVSVSDIVAFPEEVMLLVRMSSPFIKDVVVKEDLVCLFGRVYSSVVMSIEWKDDEGTALAVRCEHPPAAALRLTESREATLLFKDTNFILPSSVEYTTNSSWTRLVYETVTDSDSVILFTKGLIDNKGKPNNYSRSLDKLHCEFHGSSSGNSVTTTRVRVIAQEVVRCELPPASSYPMLTGARVSIHVPDLGGLFPSVAYFSPRSSPHPLAAAVIVQEVKSSEALNDDTQSSSKSDDGDEKSFHICACTMLWNQADFLREWVIYHGFLGIERWYLYDNNSDDDIDDVLLGLQTNYNVTRHPWPWIKTQEAGFSHCALRARADCKWVLFADVDEFVFPVKDLYELAYGKSPKYKKGRKSTGGAEIEFGPVDRSKSLSPSLSWWEEYEKSKPEELTKNKTSILRAVIDRTVQSGLDAGKKVGEVRLVCHNFGPSGLTRAPTDGVMMGYTCRMQWPKRHKSFILLDAMSDSLLNVVHHFALRDGYKQTAVYSRVAVINHYKFQAWEVFKAKFVRRVATYVVDWREQTAHSNDRAPGLGLDAVEPADWASRYCEEEDWGLRNFTYNAFRHPETEAFPWQMQELY